MSEGPLRRRVAQVLTKVDSPAPKTEPKVQQPLITPEEAEAKRIAKQEKHKARCNLIYRKNCHRSLSVFLREADARGVTGDALIAALRKYTTCLSDFTRADPFLDDAIVEVLGPVGENHGT